VSCAICGPLGRVCIHTPPKNEEGKKVDTRPQPPKK
jgi:hypothetical protein